MGNGRGGGSEGIQAMWRALTMGDRLRPSSSWNVMVRRNRAQPLPSRAPSPLYLYLYLYLYL